MQPHVEDVVRSELGTTGAEAIAARLVVVSGQVGMTAEERPSTWGTGITYFGFA